MTKYHVNDAGEAGACSAEKGNCPFGGEANHYGSKENARKAFELSMASNEVPKTKKKRETSAEAIERATKERNLKDFARIFIEDRYGWNGGDVPVEDFRATYEKLSELKESKVKLGNMFERAVQLEKIFNRDPEVDRNPDTYFTREELTDKNYLQIIAPATTHATTAVSYHLNAEGWDVEYEAQPESSVRDFSELIKRDMSAENAADEAIKFLNSRDWSIDGDVEEDRETLRKAILAGQKVALTYGNEFELEQKRLL